MNARVGRLAQAREAAQLAPEPATLGVRRASDVYTVSCTMTVGTREEDHGRARCFGSERREF